ncbi:MAG: hypothetical protein KAG66_08345, partial [Methylococcales bacterium]|nr:hypothetical protein [Methylococcales bacterium]
RISQVKERWIRNDREVKRPKHWEQKEGDLFAESVERCSIGPSCVMIRRDLWEESGGFNGFYRACEDYVLWLRICRGESIGLVPGELLSIKHAGHDDQLSDTIPALDRYRVLALLELLTLGGLSDIQHSQVLNGISAKSKILAKGAKKRSKDREEIFYRMIAEQIRVFDSYGIADWVGILLKILSTWGLLKKNEIRRFPS